MNPDTITADGFPDRCSKKILIVSRDERAESFAAQVSDLPHRGSGAGGGPERPTPSSSGRCASGQLFDRARGTEKASPRLHQIATNLLRDGARKREVEERACPVVAHPGARRRRRRDRPLRGARDGHEALETLSAEEREAVALRLRRTAVSLLTVAEIVVVMTAAANIAWASRSIRSVEFGCYGGALVLLVNSYLETGMAGSATRYGNLLGNANSYAFALMMASLFAIRRLLFTGKRSKPLAARAALILLVLLSAQQIVTATGSRKGILSLIVVSAFAIGGTWLLRGPVQALRFTIPILLVVALVFALATATPHASRMQSLVEWISGAGVRESSAAMRASMAAEARDLWREKPLFGWGFDQYRFVSSRGDYSHSNLLELMVNGGAAAVALYYAAFGFLAIDIRRQWRRTRLREERLDLAWAALIGFLLFTWSLAAVQYEQKLDTIVLAVVSVIPAILAQTAACDRNHILVPCVDEAGYSQEERTYDHARGPCRGSPDRRLSCPPRRRHNPCTGTRAETAAPLRLLQSPEQFDAGL